MTPIHESDQAEKRWETTEWSHYELWEKVEIRLRRRKYAWIGATALLFVLLASVPVVRAQLPKWGTLSEARRFSERINTIKREAIRSQTRLRLKVVSPTEFEFGPVAECRADAPYVGAWSRSRLSSDEVRFLPAEEGVAIGVPGITPSYCFSPWEKAPSSLIPSLGEEAPSAIFAFSPATDVMDLTSVSIVVLEGAHEEPRFE